jgi:hypothetical protein
MPLGLPGKAIDERSKDRSTQSRDDEEIEGVDPFHEASQPVISQGVHPSDKVPKDNGAQASANPHDQGCEQDRA